MPQCKAKSKRSGERCKRPAAAGYDVCYMHGARGGARPGNRNAVTHGAYETIFYEVLTEDERALWAGIALESMQQLDEQLRLTTIRERRMMERIANLAGVDFTVVRQIHETGQRERGVVDVLESVSEAALGQIITIEDALTRVQAHKAKLIDLKQKLRQQSDSVGATAILALVGEIRDQVRDETDDA